VLLYESLNNDQLLQITYEAEGTTAVATGVVCEINAFNKMITLFNEQSNIRFSLRFMDIFSMERCN
jgi:hypothetical protein